MSPFFECNGNITRYRAFTKIGFWGIDVAEIGFLGIGVLGIFRFFYRLVIVF